MHPHLFALLHVTHSAIGTTAEPSMTPMKVYNEGELLIDFAKYTTYIKPTHRYTDEVEDDTRQRAHKSIENDLRSSNQLSWSMLGEGPLTIQ
jgi:hypothetical protein